MACRTFAPEEDGGGVGVDDHLPPARFTARLGRPRECCVATPLSRDKVRASTRIRVDAAAAAVNSGRRALGMGGKLLRVTGKQRDGQL